MRDNIKFCTNNIPLGNKKTTFADLVQKVAAANGKVVKTAEAEADEAPSSGQPEAEAKLVNTPEAEDEGTVNCGKANNEEAPSSGQPEAEAKLVNVPKVDTTAEADTEVKEANAAGFVKLSKLNDKTRSFLKDYYSTIWPPEFVGALLQEK